MRAMPPVLLVQIGKEIQAERGAGLTSQIASGHSEEGLLNWQTVEVNLADGNARC
jgi:hypothetical protein